MINLALWLFLRPACCFLPSNTHILMYSLFSRLGAHPDLRTAGSFHQPDLLQWQCFPEAFPTAQLLAESALVSSLLIWDSTYHCLNRAYHSEDHAYLCLSLPFSLVHSHFLTPEKHWFSLGLSKFSLNKCSKNKGVTSAFYRLFTCAMTSVLVVFHNPWVCASFELFWLCFLKNFLLKNNIKHTENNIKLTVLSIGCLSALSPDLSEVIYYKLILWYPENLHVPSDVLNVQFVNYICILRLCLPKLKGLAEQKSR